MNNLSKREKSLLLILGLAVIFYLYYSFFFKPVMGKAKTVEENVKKYEIQVDKIRNAKTLIEKQKADLEKLKVQLLETLKVMPDRERNPEISLNIKNLASANGAAVNSINFGQPVEFKPQDNQKKDENSSQNTQNNGQSNTQNNGQKEQTNAQNQGEKLYAVPVTVSISGDYGQIMNFISAVEKDKRIAQVVTAALSKGQDGKLTGNLSIVFYYSGGVSEDPTNYGFNDGRADGKADLFK